MKLRTLLAAAVIGAVPFSASALSLSISGGVDFTLPNPQFTPDDTVVSLSNLVGQDIKLFDGDGSNGADANIAVGTKGLLYDGDPSPVRVDFQLLQSEAAFFNVSSTNGTVLLDNNDALGTSAAALVTQGVDTPLKFEFGTTSGTGIVSFNVADNGNSTITGGLLLGLLDRVTIFANIPDDTAAGALAASLGLFDDTSALAFFGDGTGDSDMDDLIVRITVSDPGLNPIPLPAAGWLLVSGIVGLGLIGRRKRSMAL